MHVDQFEALIEEHSANVRKLVELETGVSIDVNAPVTLIDTLEAWLADSYTQGVSYAKVSHLKALPELACMTTKLLPTNYTVEDSFIGVSTYQDILKAGLHIIKSEKVT